MDGRRVCARFRSKCGFREFMSFRRILTSPRFRERSIVLFFLPFLFLSRFYGHVVLLFSFFPALSPLFFFFLSLFRLSDLSGFIF